MDLSKAFVGFLANLKESIQLLPKNWRFTGSIFVISQLLTSILYLLYVRSLQFGIHEIAFMDDSVSSLDMLLYFLLLLALQMSFFLLFFAVSHFSGVATILVFSKSYTGEILSLGVLLSSIKRSCRRPIFSNFRVPGNSTRYLSFVIVLATLLVFRYPNFITFSIAVVVGIIAIVFQAYSSVVWSLLTVISVVDDEIEGKEALEKAVKLAPVRRLQGAMLSLFFQLPFVIILLGCWAIWGQKVSVNLMIIYSMFFFNFFCFMKMAVSAAYTGFYFQCKKDHDEKGETREDGKLLSGYYSINVV